MQRSRKSGREKHIWNVDAYMFFVCFDPKKRIIIRILDR